MLKELQMCVLAESCVGINQVIDVNMRDECLALLSLEARCDLTVFASQQTAGETLCQDLRYQDHAAHKTLRNLDVNGAKALSATGLKATFGP
jgi:hypothetical protein